MKKEEDEKESGILETSPSGRWQKLRKKLALRDSVEIDEAFLAYDTEDGYEVVWNEIDVVARNLGSEGLDRLRTKFNVLIQLKHIHLVRFYDYWIDPERTKVCFITELMTSGTLKSYIRKNKKTNKLISSRVWKRWCRQILSGLRYLHDFVPPIIHGNIRSESIFVQHNGLVKLGSICLDDLQRHVQQALEAANNATSPPFFIAPELQDHPVSSSFNCELDVYAFGMCVLEMTTLETPYSECSNASDLCKKVVSGLHPQALDRLGQDNSLLYQFISLCLNPRDSRPTAEEILFHPLLHEVPMLKVMAAHYILRNGIDYNRKGVSKQLVEFIEEVRVGAWGTLANVTFKEMRRAARIMACVVETEEMATNEIKVQVNIVFPDAMSRELVFHYRILIDTPERIANELIAEGLLCSLDRSTMTKHIADVIVK